MDGDPSGQLHRFLPGLSGFNKPVGQADGKGFFTAYGATGQDHIQSAAHSDQPGEALCASVDEGDAVTPAKNPENRIALCNPKVAPAGQLQSAGHGKTGYGGDDGFRRPHSSRTHWARFRHIEIKTVHLLKITPGDGLEVGPGTKVSPVSGQDGHKQVAVLFKFDECFNQQIGGFTVHGVSSFRTVDGDRKDPFAFFRQNFHVRILPPSIL